MLSKGFIGIFTSNLHKAPRGTYSYYCGLAEEETHYLMSVGELVAETRYSPGSVWY